MLEKKITIPLHSCRRAHMEHLAFSEPSQDQAASETDLPCAHGGSHIIREGKKMSLCFPLVTLLLMSVCCPCFSSGILGMALSSRPHSSTYVKQSSILLLLCRRHHHHPGLRFLSRQSCLHRMHANSSQAMLQGPGSFWRLFVAPSADALANASQEG